MERCRFEVHFHGCVVGTLLRVCERVVCDVQVSRCRDVEEWLSWRFFEYHSRMEVMTGNKRFNVIERVSLCSSFIEQRHPLLLRHMTDVAKQVYAESESS